MNNYDYQAPFGVREGETHAEQPEGTTGHQQGTVILPTMKFKEALKLSANRPTRTQVVRTPTSRHRMPYQVSYQGLEH